MSEMPNRRSAVRLAFNAGAMIAVTACMGGLMWLSLEGARNATKPAGQKGLTLVAWMLFALMAVSLLMLLWMLIRYFVQRTTPSGERSKTPYVDAWSLAGKRLKLKKEDQAQEEDDSQEDD